MTLYYEDEWVTIHHGDCREILPTLGCWPADALVTDPPYGIGWSRATWADNPEDYPEMIRWLVSWAQEHIKGWSFVFQAMPNVGRFHEWFPEDFRIFAACKNFAQVRKTGMWHSWDPVVCWNTAPNAAPTEGVINRDFHVGNVAGVFRSRNTHPSPRPIDTMRHIVAIAAPAGGVVVDPFMGSGTTLRAAKDLGRHAVGVEIEEQYCELAAKRMAQEVLAV